MKFEDATKIAMYRTTDLLLTFIFQRLFLNIESNLFSILGAVFIAIGMCTVISFKLIDNNEKSKLKKLKRSNEQELEVCPTREKTKLDSIVDDDDELTRNYGCFKKFIFFKF